MATEARELCNGAYWSWAKALSVRVLSRASRRSRAPQWRPSVAQSRCSPRSGGYTNSTELLELSNFLGRLRKRLVHSYEVNTELQRKNRHPRSPPTACRRISFLGEKDSIQIWPFSTKISEIGAHSLFQIWPFSTRIGETWAHSLCQIWPFSTKICEIGAHFLFEN